MEELARSQAERPASPVARFGADEPLPLDAGVSLAPFQIAYQTYGTLNADKSNAILICHALTGDQHVANVNPVTGKPGWWELMVGPGKPIDTDRYFVICANVLGGCMGTTGPASIDPKTGQPYGLDLPVITIRDMVRAQAMLVDRLGIDTLLCGASAARWAACRCCNGRRAIPERVFAAVPIACAARHSSQNIAFHEVGRQAVMADPDWCGGNYAELGMQPAQGPRRGAHGRAHHLPVRRGAAPEIRPAAAGPHQAHLRLRRGFPGRILSPPPGHRPSSTASTPTPIST